MKTFRVSGTVTVSCWTVVQAKSAEAAIEAAAERDLAEIQIDGTYDESECFHIDADGRPQGLTAEED